MMYPYATSRPLTGQTRFAARWLLAFVVAGLVASCWSLGGSAPALASVEIERPQVPIRWTRASVADSVVRALDEAQR